MVNNSNQNSSVKYLKSRIEILAKSFLRKNSNTMRYKNNTSRKNNEVSKIHGSNNGVKWTDVAMVVITAILALYTGKLFYTANTQSIAAVRAANNADKTLRETQKQFMIQTEPVLQIYQPKLLTFEIGKKPYISFQIKNLNAQAVKGYIAGMQMQLVWYEKLDSFSKNPFAFIKLRKQTKSIYYFTNVEPLISAFIPEDYILTKADSLAFVYGWKSLCFAAEIDYERSDNPTPKAYKFVIQFLLNGRDSTNPFYKIGYSFIYNENLYK